jgi:hypothetical protein
VDNTFQEVIIMNLRKNLAEAQGIIIPTLNMTPLKWLTIDTVWSVGYMDKVEVSDNYLRIAAFWVGVTGITRPKSFTFYIRDAQDLSSLQGIQACAESVLRMSLPIIKLWI